MSCQIMRTTDDAFGEKSRMRRRVVIKSVTMSRREFMRRLRQIADSGHVLGLGAPVRCPLTA
jgi:hypothetical protein